MDEARQNTGEAAGETSSELGLDANVGLGFGAAALGDRSGGEQPAATDKAGDFSGGSASLLAPDVAPDNDIKA